MGLLDDLKDQKKLAKLPNAYCVTCDLLLALPEEERIALEETLNDKTITHASISRILRANGYDIKEGTLGRHRKDGCQGVAKR